MTTAENKAEEKQTANTEDVLTLSEQLIAKNRIAYDNLQENDYLLNNPANRKFLEKSKQEADKGNVHSVPLENL